VEDPLASPITFGGLASGLDTKSIIAALVGVEGQKVTLLQNQQSAFKDKVTAFDSLLGKLNALQTSLGKIADPSQFLAFAAHLTTGGDSFFTATPLGTARAGTYKVEVGAIAQSTFIRSGGFDNPDAALSAVGDLTLRVGTTDTTIAIDGTNGTLYGVRDAINKSSAGVDATVVFDGTQYHLELRGRDTGAKNAVSVLAEPELPPPEGAVLGLTTLRAASDASFKIDGQDYTSSSNTVNGAIEGVTLQLLEGQVAGASPIQLSVTESVDKIQQQISDFVTAYNSVVSYMNDQSAPRTASTDPIKPLSGESSLSSLRLAFGSVLSSSTDFTTRYTTLSSIGIASQNDGTLAFDTNKFQDAIGKDVDGVRSLLTDATQGLGKRMLDAVKLRTDPDVGLFQSRESALHDQISGLDTRIRLQQDELGRYEDSLVQKFASYETLIGQLKAQGDSLTALTGLFTSGNSASSNLGSQSSG
jgi:flagellar hook-associated protein 2